jgi:hypothetical protein
VSPGGPTAISYSLIVRPPALAGPTINSYSLTVRPLAPVGLIASSCRTDVSNSANRTSSLTTMEDTNDDHLHYEPSPTCDGMEINVIYLSSTDYSLLEEEDVLQLAL